VVQHQNPQRKIPNFVGVGAAVKEVALFGGRPQDRVEVQAVAFCGLSGLRRDVLGWQLPQEARSLLQAFLTG